MLPLERNRYANLRILNRETYRFISSCLEPCVQPLVDVSPTVVGLRPTKTRPGMWISQVSFGKAWLITFLVFQKEKNFIIKSPQHFKFLDNALATQTQKMILQALQQEKNEVCTHKNGNCFGSTY